MKIQQQVLQDPNATPVTGLSVRLRRRSDDVTLDAQTTEGNGLVGFFLDGSHGAYYLHIPGALGGDKYWASEDVNGAGPLCIAEIPLGLRCLGDGVISGLADELEVVDASSDTVGVASGGALVAGVPFINYLIDVFPVTRPVAATRVDRFVVEFFPTGVLQEEGMARLAFLLGTEGDPDPPDLVITANWHQVSLAVVTVPVVAPISVTDARTWSGLSMDRAGVVRDDMVTTSSSTGEHLSPLTLSIVLPRSGTYDIEASLSGYQEQVDTPEGWSLTGTYTASAYNTPGQVYFDGDGRIFVADTINNRVVLNDATGTHVGALTGLYSPRGVCVDETGAIYVGDDTGVRKYTTVANFLAGTAAWEEFFGSVGHLCATSSYVYGVVFLEYYGIAQISRFNSSTGVFDTNLVNGLTVPWGIDTNSVYLYVSEGGTADRIAQYTMAGTLVRRWGTSGVGNGQFNEPRGIGINSAGELWVADYGNDRAQHFSSTGTYLETVAQANADGIATPWDDLTRFYTTNADGNSLARWDTSPAIAAGYGEIAIEIDGVVSDYTGIGDRAGWAENSAVGTKTGASTLTVRAFGKASSESLVLEQATLTARAIPRRN